MEHLPDLYRIETPGSTPDDGTPHYWPCNGLTDALSQFAHAARWLTRSQRRRARLEYLPGGNRDTPATAPTRIFRADIGGGITEITNR